MRYAKRILVAAAIFSSYTAALAFDEKEIDRHHADSFGRSSSKESTDNGAPAAKPNAPIASGSGHAAKARERVQQLSSGSSTLSSNKDIRISQPDRPQNTSTVSVKGQATIATSAGNITLYGSNHAPLTMKIQWRWHPCE
jgi:hypothetical protein